MADKKKGGGQESKKGKPRSAGKAKGKIANYYASGKLAQKKIRRALRSNGREFAGEVAGDLKQFAFLRSLEASGMADRLESARERRRLVREADAAARLEAARAKHEARRAAEAVAKLAAEKKAKRSAAAKKAAATRKANRLAVEAANDLPMAAQAASV